MTRFVFWFALALCALLPCFAIDTPFPMLPPGWTVQQSMTVPPANLAAFSQKFGAKITGLSNTILNADGQRLQVNVIECAAEADAVKVTAALRTMHASPIFCLQLGMRAVEFVCNDGRLALKAPYALGLRPRSAVYDVRLVVAAVDKCDYMKCTPLFNDFLNLQAHPDDQAAKNAVLNNARGFTFGQAITLRTLGSNSKPVAYEFSPMPESATPFAAGDGARYVFRNLPVSQDVPYVKVSTRITVQAFTATPTTRKADTALLDATPRWPSDNKQIAALAGQITAGYATPEEKAWAILDWLLPGKNLKFGGADTGSRYGVMQTLTQGYGHCWDFSDVFVTLCRAAGIPCRQVGGWLIGQSGHVWAEVLLPDQGWMPVDPTAGSACTTDYVPFFTTEDGEMPIVYLAIPVIKEETVEQ